jgi:hypothetical protein
LCAASTQVAMSGNFEVSITGAPCSSWYVLFSGP